MHAGLSELHEHSEIMTQGETLEELEENLRDAYRMMHPLRVSLHIPKISSTSNAKA